MTLYILEFRKSNHLLYRQWDRKIDNDLLYKVLPFVNCTKCAKDVVIATPTFLRQKGIVLGENEYFVLIIIKKLLVTAFWCYNPNYLYIKEVNAHFQKL